MKDPWLAIFFSVMAFLGVILQMFLDRKSAKEDGEKKLRDKASEASHHEGLSEGLERSAVVAKEDASKENDAADSLKENAAVIHAEIEKNKEKERELPKPPNVDGMTPEEIDDAFKNDGF